MEILRTPEENSVTIRTHHLDIWSSDLLSKFLEYSNGVRPWKYVQGRSHEITKFIKKYAENEMGHDRMIRTLFEQSIIDVPGAKDNYLYVCDLVGPDDKLYEKVLAGRTGYYMEIFRIAAKGKDSKIFLSEEPDDYCKSCAIGNHCNEVVSDKENKNLIYKQILMKLMETKNGKRLVERGAMGYGESGKLFITAELLFNPRFHKYLDRKLRQYAAALVK